MATLAQPAPIAVHAQEFSNNSELLRADSVYFARVAAEYPCLRALPSAWLRSDSTLAAGWRYWLGLRGQDGPCREAEGDRPRQGHVRPVVDQRAPNIDTGGLSAVGISISSATISLSSLRRLFRRCPGAWYAER